MSRPLAPGWSAHPFSHDENAVTAPAGSVKEMSGISLTRVGHGTPGGGSGVMEAGTRIGIGSASAHDGAVEHVFHRECGEDGGPVGLFAGGGEGGGGGVAG